MSSLVEEILLVRDLGKLDLYRRGGIPFTDKIWLWNVIEDCLFLLLSDDDLNLLLTREEKNGGFYPVLPMWDYICGPQEYDEYIERLDDAATQAAEYILRRRHLREGYFSLPPQTFLESLPAIQLLDCYARHSQLLSSQQTYELSEFIWKYRERLEKKADEEKVERTRVFFESLAPRTGISA